VKEIQFKSEESISTKVSLHRVRSFRHFVRGFSRHIKKWTYFRLKPSPFTGPKMFCVGPNNLGQTNNLIEF
jgi:hypothetical protein